MVFSELYSAYYNALAKIITQAQREPLTAAKAREIIGNTAFRESSVEITDAISAERWQVLHSDYTTDLKYTPTMPLTTLQKRWLKSVTLDRRFKLFGDWDFSELDDVDPLFTDEDYRVFDSYCDGDPYDDKNYIHRFKNILFALHHDKPLDITFHSSKGKRVSLTVRPERLEYSEKDDKFRLYVMGGKFGSVINLGRMEACEVHDGKTYIADCPHWERPRELLLEITDERNALERVMTHFSHFEKSVEKLDDLHYRVKLIYDADDETELIIRVLSFGPMVKAVAPERFISKIRERLIKQRNICAGGRVLPPI